MFVDEASLAGMHVRPKLPRIRPRKAIRATRLFTMGERGGGGDWSEYLKWSRGHTELTMDLRCS